MHNSYSLLLISLLIPLLLHFISNKFVESRVIVISDHRDYFGRRQYWFWKSTKALRDCYPDIQGIPVSYRDGCVL